MMPFEENIPPQGQRHATHLVGTGAIGLAAFWAKPKLENKWLGKGDALWRKIAAYVITVVGGACLGGIAKACRTGTFDGAMAGVWVGAVIAGIGAGLSELRSPASDNNSSTKPSN
jgi:hypothetical protein